jgi:hypothetical protein
MDELYGNESLLQVLFVSVVLGGGAAWLAGRAIARTWRPLWHVIASLLLLGAAVRFLHFALFEGVLLSWPSYLEDTAFQVLVGTVSWRVTRTSQMVRQYGWLYERTSPVTWRRRAAEAE